MGISWLLTYPSIPNEFLFLGDFFSLYKEKKSQKKKHLTFPLLEGVKGE